MKSWQSVLEARGYRAHDVIGILLALLFGLGGELLMANPLGFLAPQLPILSIADWPGSQLTMDVQVMDGLDWSDRRAFLLTLAQPVRAEATQVIVWFADPAAAAVEWRGYRDEPTDFEIIANSAGNQIPASELRCSTAEPMNTRECYYRAHWRNWYTYVNFVGRTPEEFSLEEMQMLATRVDQLLLAAPDRPCQGWFCSEIHPSKQDVPVPTATSPAIIATVTRFPVVTLAPLATYTSSPSSSGICAALRSTEGSNFTSLTFTNQSDGAVNVYWIDYEGSEQFWFDLQTGQSLTQETYVTHAWCVRDKNSHAALLEVIASKDEQVVTVRRAIVQHADCTSGWTRLKAGNYARVSQEQSIPNRVRKAPDTDAIVIYQIYPESILRVVEGPVCADGLVFWKVENALIPGSVGWTAEGEGQEYFLDPIQ